VTNEGSGCWAQCGAPGECDFCGSDGACCREGNEADKGVIACANSTLGCPWGHCCTIGAQAFMTADPTASPSESPTASPTAAPSGAPTAAVSAAPSAGPVEAPTSAPTGCADSPGALSYGLPCTDLVGDGFHVAAGGVAVYCPMSASDYATGVADQGASWSPPPGFTLSSKIADFCS